MGVKLGKEDQEFCWGVLTAAVLGDVAFDENYRVTAYQFLLNEVEKNLTSMWSLDIATVLEIIINENVMFLYDFEENKQKRFILF